MASAYWLDAASVAVRLGVVPGEEAALRKVRDVLAAWLHSYHRGRDGQLCQLAFTCVRLDDSTRQSMPRRAACPRT